MFERVSGQGRVGGREPEEVCISCFNAKTLQQWGLEWSSPAKGKARAKDPGAGAIAPWSAEQSWDWAPGFLP